MKKLLWALSFVCLIVSISSCNSDSGKTGAASSFNLDSVKAAINASNTSYGACFASGDSTKFASHYTSDACINPPNMPRMCGAGPIMAFFNGGVKMGIKNIKLNTEEVLGSDTYVSEIGTYDLLGDKDASLDKGKFIVVWKQVDGKWKMHRDVWNSDNPPPPAPPAEKK
jgi:ketosteroid isomerase-like protein